jgi:hypothetical protein
MPAHKHAFTITELEEDVSIETDSLTSEYEQLNKKFDSIISKIKVRKNKRRKKKLASSEAK